jgi:hypothetical protein
MPRPCPPSPAPGLALVLALAAAAPAAAQDYSGEYALMTQGQTVLALTLRQQADGRVTGSVVSGDKSLPITGTVQNGFVTFVTTGSGGGYLQWTGQLEADSLAATLVPSGPDGQPDQSQAQRHMLVRLRAGEGVSRARGSQKWLSLAMTAADTLASWCARPLYADGDVCRKLMPVVRRLAPALMITRLALGGGAAGPGAPGGVLMQPYPATSVAAAEPAPAGPALAAAPRPATATRPGPSVLSALGGGAAPARYDFVLISDGEVALAVSFTGGADGSVTGTVSAGETSVKLRGTLSGAELRFTTRAGDGTVSEWRGQLNGNGLTLTLAGRDGDETYALVARQ